MLFAKLMPRSNSCEFPRSFRGRGSLNQVKGESLAVVCSSKGFVVGPMSQKREPLLAKIVVKPLQEFQTAVLQIAPLEVAWFCLQRCPEDKNSPEKLQDVAKFPKSWSKEWAEWWVASACS